MDGSHTNQQSGHAFVVPARKKLSELALDRDYRVTDIRSVKTSFGARITVDIEEAITCYILARFVKVFEEDVNLWMQMTTAAHEKKLLMRYYGTRYNNLEFKPVRQTEG